MLRPRWHLNPCKHIRTKYRRTRAERNRAKGRETHFLRTPTHRPDRHPSPTHVRTDTLTHTHAQRLSHLRRFPSWSSTLRTCAGRASTHAAKLACLRLEHPVWRAVVPIRALRPAPGARLNDAGWPAGPTHAPCLRTCLVRGPVVPPRRWCRLRSLPDNSPPAACASSCCGRVASLVQGAVGQVHVLS